MNDVLQQQWACLTCNSKFPVGEVRPGAGSLSCDPWPCPRCGSRTITPADYRSRETDEYHGEIGTRN
jgi:DNA-directed RNA polymerase subunit RPC12/RpoP